MVKEVVEYDRRDDRKMAGEMIVRGRKEIESQKNERERLKCLEKLVSI